MRLLIRADASATIGSGHVMRCLALAQAWIDQGGQAVCVSASCPEPLANRLSAENVRHVTIDAAVGSVDDARATLKEARDHGCDWVVLDGYEFRDAYQRSLAEFPGGVLCIDDFGQCQEWGVTAVLNYNLFADTISYHGMNEEALWQGPDYALIRRELLNHHNTAKTGGPDQRILITLGGSAVAELVIQVLKQLNDHKAQALTIRVILAGAGVTPDQVVALRSATRHAVQVVVNASDMGEHYQWANKVICAAGSTCFECLYYEVPMAVIGIAENQVANYNALQQRRLAVPLGWADAIDGESLRRFVEDDRTTALGRKMVDGNGAFRVVQKMRDFVSA